MAGHERHWAHNANNSADLQGQWAVFYPAVESQEHVLPSLPQRLVSVHHPETGGEEGWGGGVRKVSLFRGLRRRATGERFIDGHSFASSK